MKQKKNVNHSFFTDFKFEFLQIRCYVFVRLCSLCFSPKCSVQLEKNANNFFEPLHFKIVLLLFLLLHLTVFLLLLFSSSSSSFTSLPNFFLQLNFCFSCCNKENNSFVKQNTNCCKFSQISKKFLKYHVITYFFFCSGFLLFLTLAVSADDNGQMMRVFVFKNKLNYCN